MHLQVQCGQRQSGLLSPEQPLSRVEASTLGTTLPLLTLDSLTCDRRMISGILSRTSLSKVLRIRVPPETSNVSAISQLGQVRANRDGNRARIIRSGECQRRTPSADIALKCLRKIWLATVQGVRPFQARSRDDQHVIRRQSVTLAVLVEPVIGRHQVPQDIHRVDHQRYQVIEIVAFAATDQLPRPRALKSKPSSRSKSMRLRSQVSGRRLSGRSVSNR
jgi:hypothetical protein